MNAFDLLRIKRELLMRCQNHHPAIIQVRRQYALQNVNRR
jgi:hypothetical protein